MPLSEQAVRDPEAAGRGVIAVADERTDLARTVAKHRLGWTCKPGDHVAIARCVREASNGATGQPSSDVPSPIGMEMGRRARRLAETTYDRRVVTEQFKEMLDSLCGT